MTDERAPAASRTKHFPWAAAAPERPGRVALSRDQIVDAAVRVLDADGLEALSMRRLGLELGAGATSLYWHVRNKDELLDLVLDRIVGEVLPDLRPGEGWRTMSVSAAQALRRVIVRHRGVAPILGERPTLGPNALQAMELVLRTFIADGFDRDGALLASNTIINWAAAAAVFEVRDPMGPSASQADREAFLAEFWEFVGSLPRDRYPTTLELLPNGATLTFDQQFDYGLQRLLDGIEASEARRRSNDGGGAPA